MPNLPDFFGLDIGNHSIKVLQLRRSGDQAELVAMGNGSTPFGLVGSENEDHQKTLAEQLRKTIDEAGIGTNLVVAALPESAIFTRLAEFPKVAEKDLEETIHWEAKQYVPIPLDEVQLDWMLVEEKMVNNKPVAQVLLVAAPKTLVNRYVKILQLADLEPIGLETESVATARAVGFSEEKNKTVAVVDFGAQGTDVSVVKNGTLVFSQSLGTGSDALTKAIATDFGFETAQAEEYKRNYGLDTSVLEGKIAQSLKPVVDVMIGEIKRTLDFFKSHFPESVPSKIVMVGDGSLLPGLMVYMTQSVGLECVLGDPFAKLTASDKTKEVAKQYAPSGFMVVVGLALKTE